MPTIRRLCVSIVAIAAVGVALPVAGGSAGEATDLNAESAAAAVAESLDRFMARSIRVQSTGEPGAPSPGAAVALVHDGRVVFTRGYGLANLEHGVPITPGTSFYIASVGKQFTAFAVALLAEEGKLSLDDPVRRHVPELPEYGQPGGPLTLRHLVHHTGGVRDWAGLQALADVRPEDLTTQRDLLDLILAQRELSFPPGSEHEYSNSGYTLLALVVERVSGQRFAAFLEERVFAPLGMDDTVVADDPGQVIPRRAESYSAADGGGFRKELMSFSAYGSGGIWSTAEDLARWLAFLDAPSFAEGAVRRMAERGVLANGDVLGYAFGLEAARVGDFAMIGHHGTHAGFRIYAGRVEGEGIGVVVLANLGSVDAREAAAEMLAAYSPAASAAVTEPDTHAEEELPGDPAAAPWRPGSEELSDYAGRYESPEVGSTITVQVSDDGLVARFRRQGEVTLKPESPGHFTGDRWFFEGASFERGPDGAPTAMRVTGYGVSGLRFERLEPMQRPSE